MAWEEIKTGSIGRFVKWSECESGPVVEGRYAGRFPSSYSTEESNQDGFVIEGDDEKVVLNHAARLDGLFKTIREGDLVKVSYGGKKIVGKSDKPSHQFTVLIDREASVPSKKELPF